MKITVRQLKRLIREAVGKINLGDRVRKLDQRSAVINNISIRNNDKETIKNKLSEQLEETFSELDMSDEDAMYGILFEKSDFILDRMVDADFATEVESVFSKREIAKIIADWQKNKIEELVEEMEIPRPLRKMLQGFM